MMFSSRLRQRGGRNRLARALDGRRAAGLPIVDLTLSNPTRAGLSYPPALLRPLADERALCYDPEPRGLPGARRAVAEDFGRRGLTVTDDRVLLTASTSEAYSLLFKLLCDPGDVVLAPRPSYPLIEYLTDLDGVVVDQYDLDLHGRWAIDVDGLAARVAAAGGRARAVIVVSPNNPTGSLLSATELEAIGALAGAEGLAIIADEVFADYVMTGRRPLSALEQDAALTFVLGGLSKSVGLPQVKLGWIAAAGPSTLVSDALDRLETISDAYLSVSTPAQVAAPHLLAQGGVVRAQIRERLAQNLAHLAACAAGYPACSVLPVEAGWYAAVQVPAVASEEELVLDLLNGAGVLAHPGYFFDFAREAFLVVSLLPDPAVFAAGVGALFERVGGRR